MSSQSCSPEDARARLCALGDHLRDVVVSGRPAVDATEIVGATVADTTYAIDKIADDALLAWFERHWPDVELVSEGLDEPMRIGRDPSWTVIVDPIDGTRGLMYDKRSAWVLAAAAPRGGRLRDIVAAAMTEIPTLKQRAADQLSGTRGFALVAARVDCATGAATPLTIRPSQATDLEHGFGGFAKFFVTGKRELATLEGELFERLGARHVFDDEYLSSGGQIHELAAGHDRFVADVRPLLLTDALACHPYDICCAMLLELAGGVVTDLWGAPLDAPLDTTTPIGWVGYANPSLANWIGPVLTDILRVYADS